MFLNVLVAASVVCPTIKNANYPSQFQLVHGVFSLTPGKPVSNAGQQH